jgi:hypothetical protein
MSRIAPPTSRGNSIMTVPIDPVQLTRLFAFIAKGLVWYHWGSYTDEECDIWSGILNSEGEAVFMHYMGANGPNHVRRELGVGTFAYEGARGVDNPVMSMWVFTIYGGLRMTGDPDAPDEEGSKVGVLIAAKEFIGKFKALVSGDEPRA